MIVAGWPCDVQVMLSGLCQSDAPQRALPHLPAALSPSQDPLSTQQRQLFSGGQSRHGCGQCDGVLQLQRRLPECETVHRTVGTPTGNSGVTLLEVAGRSEQLF